MERQLPFKFEEEFLTTWINTLKEAQKESIRLALKEMIVANFKKETQDGNGEN